MNNLEDPLEKWMDREINTPMEIFLVPIPYIVEYIIYAFYH